MVKKKKVPDTKAWASFRIRGIQATLKTLLENELLSEEVKFCLWKASAGIRGAVRQLNKERKTK